MKKYRYFFLWLILFYPTFLFASEECSNSPDNAYFCEGALKVTVVNKSKETIHIYSDSNVYSSGRKCDERIDPNEEFTCTIPTWAGVGDEYGSFVVETLNGINRNQYQYRLTSIRPKTLRWEPLLKQSPDTINLTTLITSDIKPGICGKSPSGSDSFVCNNAAKIEFGFVPCPNAVHCSNKDPNDLHCRAADTSPLSAQINRIWNQNGAAAVWYLATEENFERLFDTSRNYNLNSARNPKLIVPLNRQNTKCQYDQEKNLTLQYCMFLNENNEPSYFCKGGGEGEEVIKWKMFKLSP